MLASAWAARYAFAASPAVYATAATDETSA